MLGGLIAAAPILDVGAKIFGGLLGSSSAKKQNKAQVALAREQMAFQERMSSTAHQREVKDLRAAGLNPILSAGGKGASSPGGAMPNVVSEQAPMAQAMMQGLGSAVQIQNTLAQTEHIKEQARTEYQRGRETKYRASNEHIQNLVNEALYLSGGQEEKFRQELRRLKSEATLSEMRQPEQEATAKMWKSFEGTADQGDSLMKTIMLIMRMMK